MVEWPDRRPVSAAFLHAEWGKEAPKAGIEGTNPRRWYFPTVDAFSPEGRAMLRKMLIHQAQRAVDAVEMVGGQGVLLWNMEGAYHSTGFVGDPRMLPLMNPEMDEAMDDYYRVIRDAGYRVGMVIRHPQPRWSGGAKEGTWTQGVGNINPNYDYVKDGYTKLLPEHRPWWTVYPIARRLSDKIRYAKRRWDASIFYYDTSLVMYFDWQDRVPEQRRGAATLLAHLATHTGEKAGPAGSDISDAALLDVLIFPEFFERGNPMPGNLAYVAPYGQTGYGRVRPVTGHSQKGTQDFTRDLVPGYFGFHFIHDAGGDASLYRTARINEVVWGEILVTDVGTGPKQRSIREHYLEGNDHLGHVTAVARHFGLLDRPEKFLPLPYVLEAARRIDVQGLARDPSRQEQLRPHTVSGADRREAALFLAWYGWPYSPPVDLDPALPGVDLVEGERYVWDTETGKLLNTPGGAIHEPEAPPVEAASVNLDASPDEPLDANDEGNIGSLLAENIEDVLEIQPNAAGENPPARKIRFKYDDRNQALRYFE